LPGGFENGCVSGSRLGNDRVYFFSIAGVVCERDPGKTLAIGCNIRILSKFVPWVQGKGHPSVLKGHAKRDDAHRLFHQLLPGGPNVPSTDEDRPAQPANQRNLG
jgi:hypothetical protein